MTITTDQFEAAITAAFKAGEAWGITHHTWFTPSENENRLKVVDALLEAYNSLETQTPKEGESK